MNSNTITLARIHYFLPLYFIKKENYHSMWKQIFEQKHYLSTNTVRISYSSNCISWFLVVKYNLLKYSQTCVNNHLWATTACVQRPAWSQIFKIDRIFIKNKLLIMATLEQWPLFWLPRMAIVHRFDCTMKTFLFN
jgi:hypothetical protein